MGCIFHTSPFNTQEFMWNRDVKIVRVKRWYTAPRKQTQQGSCTQTLTETVTTCTRLVQVKNRSETQIEEGKVSANSHL